MLGEKIREQRKIKGFTQKELAEKSGLSLSAIEKYEKGTRVPSFEALISLGEALDYGLIGFKLALQKRKTSDAQIKLIQTYINTCGFDIDISKYENDCRISELKRDIDKLISNTLMNIQQDGHC